MEQQIRFCTAADGARIAYATAGEGPPLVKAANWLSHLEFDWRSPVWRHWLEELSRDHTLVRYDERGCGLSDWDVEDFSFEAWVRDLETVVDALALERFPLLGISQGGPVAITYALRHAERVSHLILYGSYDRGWYKRKVSPETMEEIKALVTITRRGWGRDNPAYRQIFTSSFIPGASAEQATWFNDLQRVSTTPENAARFIEEFSNIDVSEVVPEVATPTLILHARDDQRVPFEGGRLLAAAIPNARFVPLDSANHILLEDEPAWRQFLAEVRRFLDVRVEAGESPGGGVHTILFTDVEGSTALTERLGDERARELLREHERIVREALESHRGSEVKTMGDGFMASFPSAARALECAVAIQRAFDEYNVDVGAHGRVPLRVRIGLNAGEPIAEESDLFGTAVIAAARIAGQAEGGEVLVSDVVRQLVAGKGFLFADRGAVPLKGFEEPLRLHEVRWRGE